MELRPVPSRATAAVILARGLGTRMRVDDGALLAPTQLPAAAAGAKGLIPVGEGGRPLLDFVLSELADGGVRDVVFVVAPGENAVRERYLSVAPPERLGIRFAEQREPRGTSDALLAAREAVEACAGSGIRGSGGSGDFLMLNADNLYPAASVAALVELGGPGLVAFQADALVTQGNIDRGRVMQFALLDIAPDDTLAEIVEKPWPTHPLVTAPEQWVSMNLWRFSSAIFDDCAAVRPSVRGEFELADAVRLAIVARGERFRVVRQRLGVLDLSRRSDVALVQARLAGRVPRP